MRTAKDVSVALNLEKRLKKLKSEKGKKSGEAEASNLTERWGQKMSNSLIFLSPFSV